MSSSHERERQAPPEVPRRPAATRPGPILSPPTPAVPAHQDLAHGPQPAIREIHKNAWLKRHAASERKGTPFVKKFEKYWVVFCVHDDTEAFLEFYTDPKMAATHKPLCRTSLCTCLHVSPSIIGQDNEYQFAVTLLDQVIRLTAANWDQMVEWVESMQGKLREMNILRPKENLYTALPESRCCSNATYPVYHVSSLLSSSASTRDPNSPLPPTPPGWVSPVLGTEASVPFEMDEDPGVIYIDTTALLDSNRPTPVFSGPSRNLHLNLSSSANGFLFESPEASNSVYVKAVTGGISSSRDGSGSDSGNGSGGSLTSVDLSKLSAGLATRPTTSSHKVHNDTASEESIGSRNTARPPAAVSVAAGTSSNGVTYTTLVQIGSEIIINGEPAQPMTVTKTNAFSSTAASGDIHSSPGNSDTNFLSRPRPKPRPKIIEASQGLTVSTLVPPPGGVSPISYERQLSAPPQLGHVSSSENLYEHLFIPQNSVLNTNVIRANSARNGSRKASQSRNNTTVPEQEGSGEDPPPLVPRRTPHSRRQQNPQPQRSSSLSRLELSGGVVFTNDPFPSDRVNVSRPTRRHRAPRPEVIHHNFSDPSPSGVYPMESMIGVRSGEYRIRREEVPPGAGNHIKGVESARSNPAHSSHEPHFQGSALVEPSEGPPCSSHVPLKEQQVIRLQSEINHPGGVRLVLRKKDCLGSIAFIDYLGAVWIAGWKQQQHPVLYYAFHIGDQVVRVAGVTVQNSVEANRAIKMVSSMQVEFIIQRLPYGKVYVFKRSREGEPLGIVAVGNSGEIGEVLPAGLAFAQGLSLKAPSGCNWFLTEVNNRPLNLLARENEVRDRLNAVGREISILVQPSDLVKHLRKQLKSFKGSKDFLVI